MTNSTGPDPLSPEERRAVLREHLEREKERRRTAEAMLAVVRERAGTWAALAPADDWGLTPADTVAADCGRAILALIGEPQERSDEKEADDGQH